MLTEVALQHRVISGIAELQERDRQSFFPRAAWPAPHG